MSAAPRLVWPKICALRQKVANKNNMTAKLFRHCYTGVHFGPLDLWIG